MKLPENIKCSRCGKIKPRGQINGYDPITGDVSQAYCSRLAECQSAEAERQMDEVAHEYDTEDDGTLTDKAVAELAFEIIEKLNGLPVGVAQNVLERTKGWLLDCHVVDTSNQRFKTKISEVQGCVAYDSSHSKPTRSFFRDEKDVKPSDLKPTVQKELPLRHKQFLEVIGHPEMWQMFRDSAINSFCKDEHKVRVLETHPLYPMLAVDFKTIPLHHQAHSKTKEMSKRPFSFDDLADLAEHVHVRWKAAQATTHQ